MCCILNLFWIINSAFDKSSLSLIPIKSSSELDTKPTLEPSFTHIEIISVKKYSPLLDFLTLFR